MIVFEDVAESLTILSSRREFAGQAVGNIKPHRYSRIPFLRSFGHDVIRCGDIDNNIFVHRVVHQIDIVGEFVFLFHLISNIVVGELVEMKNSSLVSRSPNALGVGGE